MTERISQFPTSSKAKATESNSLNEWIAMLPTLTISPDDLRQLGFSDHSIDQLTPSCYETLSATLYQQLFIALVWEELCFQTYALLETLPDPML